MSAADPPANADIDCERCNGRFAVADLVDSIDGYWREVRVFSARRPCCRGSEELQLRGRTLTRGYTYAAGAPHFEGLVDHRIAGLTVTDEGSAMRLTFRGRTWTVPAT